MRKSTRPIARPLSNSRRVWSQITSSLSDIRITFSEDPTLAAALDEFSLRLFGPAAERIGWEPSTDEDFLTGQLRTLLLWNAGRAGHKR